MRPPTPPALDELRPHIPRIGHVPDGTRRPLCSVMIPTYNCDAYLYVVMPYRAEHYELCATGSMLDAIACEKLLIATRLPIFQNLERRYG
jgi:hypothetical protein